MADNTLFNNLNNDPTTQSLTEIISSIMELPDETLQDTTKESLLGMFAGAFTPSVQNETIKGIIEFFENNGHTKTSAASLVTQIKQEIKDLIDSLQPSTNKREILEGLFNQLISMYGKALERYHSAAFTLNMTLEEGAHEPTYAHTTDAAADLYAADTVTLAPHSLSIMIRTGVHIQLPEGWMAMIVPRSSIGVKTGLRLSNSVGIIDQSYLGQLGVIYDNISDEPYTINAGDRIAQLLIFPSYQFKTNIVGKLEDTDRGENGFGSSGK